MPLLAVISGIAADYPRYGGSEAICFRPLRSLRIYPLLHRWLNAPPVARWWYGHGTSWRGIEEQYIKTTSCANG